MNIDISGAASHLGVSTETVRRRLRTGTLSGEKEKTAQGFRWVVNIPDTPPNNTPPLGEVTDDANGGPLVEILREELAEKNHQISELHRQISELHQLLAQTALNAAPGRPWWKLWK